MSELAESVGARTPEGKPGTPCTIDKWIVGEFNCSCVGISKCLPAYCKALWDGAQERSQKWKSLKQA